MAKSDIDAKQKRFYSPSTEDPVVGRVPRMNFLTVDGEGGPNAASVFRETIVRLREKRDSPLTAWLRFASLVEGWCVQVMHIGPYSEEKPTIARLHSLAKERGYVLAGRHHEIYLGDPRRTKPEKRRTVIRTPVRKEGE